jgi:hypothetical protein
VVISAICNATKELANKLIKTSLVENLAKEPEKIVGIYAVSFVIQTKNVNLMHVKHKFL